MHYDFALCHFTRRREKFKSFLQLLRLLQKQAFCFQQLYVYCRNLWLPIFLHFAWDFTEPGIFGGINPGNTVEQSLFTPEISGPDFLTGGESGPQNSLQAAVILPGSPDSFFSGWQREKIHIISFTKYTDAILLVVQLSVVNRQPPTCPSGNRHTFNRQR